MKYGFASFSDYPLSDWSSLIARIYVDAFQLRPYEVEDYEWKPVDQIKSRDVDEVELTRRLSRFSKNENETPCSIPFTNSVKRLLKELDAIEERNNCRVNFLLLPAPNSRGDLEEYTRLFGKERCFNMVDEHMDPQLFIDNNHLNAKGAEVISRQFNKIKDANP